jgi:hypothetical protein
MLRSEAVGFKRQIDLARKVGCTRERVSRWFAMAEPPKRMRKGFDQQLARALETTPQTLYVEFGHVPPEKAARVVGGPFDIYPGTLSTSPTITDGALIEEVLTRLMPSEMEKVLEYAILLVRAKGDGRAAEFDRYFKAHAVSRPLALQIKP